MVTSLSGALAQSRRVDKISNNLANADTPGFKADDLAFEEMLTEAHRQDTRTDIPERAATDRELFARHGDSTRPVLYGTEFTNLRQGAFRQTNNPMDFAIEGNGFFEVLSPQGVRLTRAGNFAVDGGGRLVNRDGFPILSAGANPDPSKRVIQVGAASLNADAEGTLYDSRDGQVPLGKLSMIQVENPKALKKVGHSLFEAGPDAFLKSNRDPASVETEVEMPKENPLGSTAQAPKLHQGMLEGSNVNPVAEMTKLIQAHRLFEQNIKVLESVGDLQNRVSEVGKY